MSHTSLRRTYDDSFETGGSRFESPDRACLADLIAVLQANPGGLRRWSVMRAMRQRVEKAGNEVPMKFEDNVGRVFRAHCATDTAIPGSTLFYLPKDRAGEVWAVHAEKAKAWLAGETP